MLKSEGQQAAGTTAVIELAGLAPPVIHSLFARAIYATRLFNVTITNVPGPQQTLYALGAPMREVYPLVPLAAEHAIGVAAASYDGSVFFGVVADRDTVPDLDVMLNGLGASVEELLAVAHADRVALKDGAPGPRRPAGDPRLALRTACDFCEYTLRHGESGRRTCARVLPGGPAISPPRRAATSWSRSPTL